MEEIANPVPTQELTPAADYPPELDTPATFTGRRHRFDYESAAASIVPTMLASISGVSESDRDAFRNVARAAAEKLRIIGQPRSRKQTEALGDEELARAIVLLAAGVVPDDVATLIGCSLSTLYRWKAHDADFAIAWDRARSAMGDRVLGRMYTIALTGDAGNVATVRAAGIALDRLSPKAPQSSRIQALEVRQETASGARAIRVSISTPTPD